MESLIVLALISIFLLFPILQTKHLAKTYQNTYFYKQVNQNLPKLQELCIQRKAEGKVVNQEKQLVFLVGNTIEEKLTIPLPKEVVVSFTTKGDNGKVIDSIDFDKLGNNSSFPRIYFKDSFQKRTIIYLFQLYRGKFHIRYE